MEYDFNYTPEHVQRTINTVFRGINLSEQLRQDLADEYKTRTYMLNLYRSRNFNNPNNKENFLSILLFYFEAYVRDTEEIDYPSYNTGSFLNMLHEHRETKLAVWLATDGILKNQENIDKIRGMLFINIVTDADFDHDKQVIVQKLLNATEKFEFDDIYVEHQWEMIEECENMFSLAYLEETIYSNNFRASKLKNLTQENILEIYDQRNQLLTNMGELLAQQNEEEEMEE
jgi:hypothetical protein